MEIFLTSISGILVILGMILVGFVMGEKGWLYTLFIGTVLVKISTCV